MKTETTENTAVSTQEAIARNLAEYKEWLRNLLIELYPEYGSKVP